MSPPLSLVFLHYWAGSGREWHPLITALGLECECLAPDLPGFGDAPPPARFTLDAYADAVAQFMAEKNLAEYVLVGHSMGGKIALALAAQRPNGLRGVALLAPSPPTPEPMTEAARAAALAAYGNPAAAAATAERITARPMPDAEQQQVIADNLRTSRAAWEWWLLYGSREDIAARLPQLQVPVLLLCGTADAAIPAQVQQTETLPYLPVGTTLHLLEGVGHLLPLEAPGEVAVALRQFIAELTPPSPR
ncbi:alpha/beta hydrolase [Hymenobacter busanensis]|uniref:Alpha/beta hydrolase n=1 Tax=Hymenobacter busanensis TaxID=2607656 RepID=A0A7L4ZZL3_9BACT|nr:alpha/beta hydrolase [Hymenobacter busanensis]KAA9333110.1 alpha/beta hydrolase [Hymenobacter busanensis]QHJ08215.1 alpha/beta fold hydrolase [Hymenobacter busanensis]